MTVSFFHTIAPMKGKPDIEILEACEEICPGLFSQLTDIDDTDASLPQGSIPCIIMYIIFAYSKESPRVVMGTYLKQAKELIAKYLNIPDTFIQYTVGMNHPVIRKVIMEYLDFQADRDFRHLMRKRDMYELMADQQMKELLDKDGNVDFKAANESSKQMDVMLRDIEACEDKIAERYSFIFDTIADIKHMAMGETFSLKIEDSKFIR